MQETTQELPPQRSTPEMVSAMLAQRCREDHAFAVRLRKDPRGTILELTRQQGIDDALMPKHINLWENTPQHWHLAVPGKEIVADMKKLPQMGSLTDEDLEDVHGGALAMILVGFAITPATINALAAAFAIAGAAASAVAVGAAVAVTVPLLQKYGKV